MLVIYTNDITAINIIQENNICINFNCRRNNVISKNKIAHPQVGANVVHYDPFQFQTVKSTSTFASCVTYSCPAHEQKLF